MKDQTLSLRLPGSIFQWIERARGEMDTSTYIAKLPQERIEQVQRETAERKEWLAEGRKQYTEKICQQTLQTMRFFRKDQRLEALFVPSALRNSPERV